MKTRHCAHMLAAVAAGALLAAPAPAALPCDADLDGSGDVGITDLLELLGLWGTDPGGPPDFDGSGGVGITDLLRLLERWGPIAIDFGPPAADAEAAQIGLEMLGAAGPLLLPPGIYQRVDADLDAIRAFEPSLAGEAHTPAWVADQLLVSLVGGAALDEYLCLNEVHDVVSIQLISQSLNLYLLTFAGDLNVPAVAQVYAAAPEVSYAEPNGLIGGENTWSPQELGDGTWRWEVDDGFLDCFDGCDCHRFWVFETDARGAVAFVSYQEFGAPWCDFGGP